MENKLELLREFDEAGAKRGEPICTTDGICVKYIAGPNRLNTVVVQWYDQQFHTPNKNGLRMAPLHWKDGRPVYRGDVLYLSGKSVTVKDMTLGVFITSNCLIPPGLLTWEKSHISVKFIEWPDHVPPKAPPPPTKNLSLLRPFDLEKAKAGEPICNASGEPRKFDNGPDEDGMIGVFYVDGSGLGRSVWGRPNDYRMAPLGWVDDRPVYEGDNLYLEGAPVIAMRKYAGLTKPAIIVMKAGASSVVVPLDELAWDVPNDAKASANQGYVAIIPGNQEGAWHSVPGATAVWSLYPSEDDARRAYPNAIAIMGPVEVPAVKNKAGA